MRSSQVLMWLCLAASQHPPAVLGYDGSSSGDAQVRDRICDSDSCRHHDGEKGHLGLLDTSDFPLADGSIPDGLGDSEEVRVRYGTNLKSEDGIWEVRPSPGKGLGVFARRKIPKHTIIIDETPLFTVDPGSLVSGQGFAFDTIATAVDEAFERLNATARAAYLSCPENRDADDAKFSREALIFRTNGFTMAGGTIGIFPRIAKLNHACRPNAASVSVGGRRVIWAGRDIAAGEEVTATYAPLTETTEARRARLAQWGFTCDCQSCAARDGGEGAAEDLKRVEMKRLTGLVEQELGRDEFGGDVLPLAEKLVKLVEEVGLVDYLSKAYKYAAYSASRAGKYGAARKWAKKELKVHEIADAESVYAKQTREFLDSLPLF
ncbi:SET domain-containing protein 5 [Colletotrichum karsti]|uniref:SET domain-containing protein 5 n=1 Tax=Colletotrichum karsti TaxID=1095194 RepID=A0A9P6LEF4_9PEZI|nr:SET domain-containing protein 5 [Colletotrichum karsti]KAF9870358.1 SET domain-containing protein 5 [Colletotrichum karsti]